VAAAAVYIDADVSALRALRQRSGATATGVIAGRLS
jgi:hypothetical protein